MLTYDEDYPDDFDCICCGMPALSPKCRYCTANCTDDHCTMGDDENLHLFADY